MTRLVVLLAALLAAAAAVQASQATFTASKTNSGSSFVTAAKFPPTVTLTTPADGSATKDTTPLFSGTADNATGDATTVTATVYSGTSATGSPVQTPKSGSRSGTSFSFSLTTALAPGTYTAVVTQTDGAGNTGTSNANTFTVDTAKPTATLVKAANKTGGTAGKIENGDTVTFTYSEPIAPSSVWSGWDGSSTNVKVTFTNATTDTFTVVTATTGTIKLGSVATNGNYVTATTTFAGTMVRSADGASIVVTLGTPASVQSTAVTAKNMKWTVGAGITDLAGNTIATPASYTETDTDVDF